MKPLVACLSVFLFVGIAHAETLDHDIQRALMHSPELHMAEARVNYAEAQLHSARRGWFHPQLSVSAGESAATGTMRAGIAISQDLDRLLARNHTEVRQAEHELIIAQQALTRTRESVIRQVYETSVALHLAQATLTLRQHVVPDAQKTLTLIQQQFQAGTVTLDQLLTVQHTLAQTETELLQAQAAWRIAQVAWAQLLGEPMPQDDTGP